MKKQIAILGSTGSIGTQALDVISQHPDLFEVYCLTANNQVEPLAEQAHKYNPDSVVIANEAHYSRLQELLADKPEIKVYAGAKALDDIVEATPIDIVLTAMVGFAGLSPTIHAIKAGKKIALANKETLVVAGDLICELVQSAECRVQSTGGRVQRNSGPLIIPVDSEHSAIFQSLAGEGDNGIEKLLLTASGGPFRNMSIEELQNVTKADALRHPTWDMGAKITIDSATMMNKGFEVIEAKWLFGIPAERIQVLIHPQSIVHSAVQFVDGSIKAQLGVPDMRLPIQYAFSYPTRLTLNGERLDPFKQKLEFFEPDLEKFRCLALAFEAIKQGGNACCVMNAANEIVNRAFLEDRCSFPQIAEIIEKTMQTATFIKKPTLSDYLESDKEARRIATESLTQSPSPTR